MTKILLTLWELEILPNPCYRVQAGRGILRGVTSSLMSDTWGNPGKPWQISRCCLDPGFGVEGFLVSGEVTGLPKVTTVKTRLWWRPGRQRDSLAATTSHKSDINTEEILTYYFVYQILDTIISIRLFVLLHDTQTTPPWILKRGGLKSSGQRLISINSKTRRKAFYIFFLFL